MKSTPNKPYNNAAKVLRKIRAKLAISQAELGKALKAGRQSISNAERGLAYLTTKQLKSLSKLSTLTSVYMDAYIVDKTEQARQRINKLRSK